MVVGNKDYEHRLLFELYKGSRCSAGCYSATSTHSLLEFKMSQEHGTENSRAADLIAELATFTSEDLLNDPTGRARAVALSKKLTTTLENPVDRYASCQRLGKHFK
jgi:hypothetical protein